MIEITEEELYEGVSIDYMFNELKPTFGDLFEICGYSNPHFPPTGNFKFSEFTELQFSQVDDYFGVPSISGEGDDVVVWLYPLVSNKIVDHHPGPFDGIKLGFNVLRNPDHRKNHFFKVCGTLESELDISASQSVETIKLKIEAISDSWKGKGIEPGSGPALEIDY